MLVRVLGAVLLVGQLLVGGATAAVATEGGAAERPAYEEIVERAGDAGGQFLPEEYERPGFFDWIILPLVVLGVVITTLILVRYLASQPRFTAEAEKRSRR
jgi:hypothetical protein